MERIVRLKPYRPKGISRCKVSETRSTYTIENKEATKEATPATIIVACVNFSPVPPEILPAMEISLVNLPDSRYFSPVPATPFPTRYDAFENVGKSSP